MIGGRWPARNSSRPAPAGRGTRIAAAAGTDWWSALRPAPRGGVVGAAHVADEAVLERVQQQRTAATTSVTANSPAASSVTREPHRAVARRHAASHAHASTPHGRVVDEAVAERAHGLQAVAGERPVDLACGGSRRRPRRCCRRPRSRSPTPRLSSSCFVATPPSRRASATSSVQLPRREHELARPAPAAPLVGSTRRSPMESTPSGALVARRISARSRATSTTKLNGLRRKSSAPRSRPSASSCSPCLAVSISTGVRSPPRPQLAAQRRSRSARAAGCRARSPRRRPRGPATARPVRCGRGRPRSPRPAGRGRRPRPGAPRPRPPARARAESDGRRPSTGTRLSAHSQRSLIGLSASVSVDACDAGMTARAPRRPTAPLAVIARAARLAACGGDDGRRTTATTATTTSPALDDATPTRRRTTPTRATPRPTDAASTDPEEAMLAFTECMRDHGIDMPDPQMASRRRAAPSPATPSSPSRATRRRRRSRRPRRRASR